MRMMRFLVCIFCVTLLFTSLCCAEEEDPLTQTTVMVYLCGSDLESGATSYGSAYNDVREMLISGYDTDHTNVVIMAGGTSKWSEGSNLDAAKSTVLTIVPGRGQSILRTKTVEEWELMNMSESGTLSRFLCWACEYAPADRYALILWNHGGGPVEGVCYDENFPGDMLTVTELAQALENSPFAAQPLEWIGFDACLMCSVETAEKVSPYARYMIASEETEPGDMGWNYRFLNGLEQDRDGAETGRRIVDSYFDGAKNEYGCLTLSCLDLSEIQALDQSMELFFGSITDQLTIESWASISSMRTGAVNFGKFMDNSSYDMVDIVSLCRCYSDMFPEQCETVVRAVDKAVVYARSSIEGVGGISIYHPYRNRNAYVSMWKNRYRSLDFCPGYTTYISTYGALMTGEHFVCWNRLGAPEAVYTEDGCARCSLPLTQVEAENIASARLIVVSRELLTSTEDVYSRLFSTSDVAIGTDGLRAVYDGTCMEMWKPSCLSSLTGAISYSTTEENTYLVPMSLLDSNGNDMGLVVYGEYVPEKGTKRLMLKRYLIYDELLGQYSCLDDLDCFDYSGIYFPRDYRVPTETPLGELVGYDAWEISDQPILPYRSLVGQDPFIPVISKMSRAEQLFAMFEVTDLQGNIYCSEMTPIESSVVFPEIEYNETVTELSEDKPLLSVTPEIIIVPVVDNADKINADVILKLFVTNLDNRNLRFSALHFSLNGREFPDLYALSVSSADRPSGYVAPGETQVRLVRIHQSDLITLIPDTAVENITAELIVFDDQNDEETGKPRKLQVRDLQMETLIPLDSFCENADILPSPGFVRNEEANETSSFRTGNESTIFENQLLRVSLAGLYSVDERIVMLVHIENRNERTALINLFDAKVNGRVAEIGLHETTHMLEHNRQLEKFGLTDNQWNVSRSAGLVINEGGSIYEYISVKPPKSENMLQELRFKLYMYTTAPDNAYYNTVSEDVVVSCDPFLPLIFGIEAYPEGSEASVHPAKEASDNQAQIVFELEDRLIDKKPEMYELVFDAPDEATLNTVSYFLFKKLDSDLELAQHHIKEFSNTGFPYGEGHGWLMWLAEGSMKLSNDGMSAKGELYGVLPALAYGQDHVLLSVLQQKRMGKNLMLTKVAKTLTYESSDFAGIPFDRAIISYRIVLNTDDWSGNVVTYNDCFYPAGLSLASIQDVGLIHPDEPIDANAFDASAGVMGLPIDGNSTTIRLLTLDDPTDYYVVFAYTCASENGIRFSAPTPLTNFPIRKQ